MAENLAAAACTEREWELATAAGLPFAPGGTTAQERAIHAFAEAIRADTLTPLSDEQIDRLVGEMYVPITGHPSQFPSWCREFARAVIAASTGPRHG